MEAVFRAEAAAISAIEVDADFISAVEVMMACRGKILTTGIGKAGHIAKKFAATLCSTATPADFIHPAEAAHGDLGLVGSNDVMIAFSTSGKSREVLEIMEMSRHLGVDKIIGVTSHLDSELRNPQRFDFKHGCHYRTLSLGPDAPARLWPLCWPSATPLLQRCWSKKALPAKTTACATTAATLVGPPGPITSRVRNPRAARGLDCRAAISSASNPPWPAGSCSGLAPSLV